MIVEPLSGPQSPSGSLQAGTDGDALGVRK